MAGSKRRAKSASKAPSGSDERASVVPSLGGSPPEATTNARKPLRPRWSLAQALAYYVAPLEALIAFIKDCPETKGSHLISAGRDEYRQLFDDAYNAFCLVNRWVHEAWADGALKEPEKVSARVELAQELSRYAELRAKPDGEGPWHRLRVTKRAVEDVEEVIRQWRRRWMGKLRSPDSKEGESNSKGTADRLRPCVEKAGEAMNHLHNERPEMFPPLGEAISEMAWKWITQHYYSTPGKPDLETFRRYVRESNRHFGLGEDSYPKNLRSREPANIRPRRKQD